MFKHLEHVLVPVDFSSCSKQALSVACELSERYGAKLTLLHVYQTPGLVYPEGFIPASPQAYRDLIAKIDDSLAQWQAQAQGNGARSVMVKAAEGFPWREIVREASEGNYDLLVIGTHGFTGAKHLFLGSVAENVVRRADCPVLTIRTKGSSSQSS